MVNSVMLLRRTLASRDLSRQHKPCTFNNFQTLCAPRKSQLPRNQQLPNSFRKMPGYGILGRVYGTPEVRLQRNMRTLKRSNVPTIRVSPVDSVLTPNPPATPLESVLTKNNRGASGNSFPFQTSLDGQTCQLRNSHSAYA